MSSCLVRNNVTVIGRADAPRTMVLIHGFGTDQNVWSEAARRFAPDFRIVLLDNVGAGKSDPDAFDGGVYRDHLAYAEDVLDVCEELGLRGAVLVGHSVGAMIAVLAADQGGDYFSKLVLIGASPRYLNEPGYHGGFEQAELEGIYTAITTRFHEWAETFAGAVLGPEVDAAAVTEFAGSLKSIPLQRAYTVLYSIFQSDHRAAVARIHLPCLLIYTSNDAVVPHSVVEYMHSAIPGSQLRIIESQGHLPHLTVPDLVYEAMREFVAAD